MELIKFFGIIILCVVICIIFKNYKSEYSIAITTICLCLIFGAVLKKIVSPILLIQQKIEQSGIDSYYFKTALKALGIGYLTSFIADSCKDAGFTSLANGAEFVGKCAIFLLCIPLMLTVLETAVGFVK